MKPCFRLLLVLVAFAVWTSQASAACAPAQILRDDVLVVVNDNSISSPQVGDYYCEQRGIDPANVAHVRVPATNDVELDQFISLRDQLIRHMQENTLPPGVVPVACDTSQGYTHYYCPQSVDQLRQQSRIRYVVMTRGVPVRFTFTGTTLPFNKEASIDNYLRFWLTNYFSGDVAFNIKNRAIAFGDGRGMRTVDTPVDRELVVGRIDGVDTESAKRLVDRAINAEMNGIYGKLYGNKFGPFALESGPEGAYWKSWLSDGSIATVYPSWRYLHGLFGELNGLAGLAVRHVTNPECLTYDIDGKVPRDCVTAINVGGIPDAFSIDDAPPGTSWGRIPRPDNALVYQGYLDGFTTVVDFNDLLNWREDDSCNTLCSAGDAVCKAASTDAYKEIDTRCVRVADGFIGYNFNSFPVGAMASWPTGWFQSTSINPLHFGHSGNFAYFHGQPEVRDDQGFDDNFSLWYRYADEVSSAACYTGVEDYLSPPAAACKKDRWFNINQAIAIPERAINLASPQKITVRFKYRAIDLNKYIRLEASLLVRESAYDDGTITIPYNNQLVYGPIVIKTIAPPNDPASGVGWADGVATFTLDPSLHNHPQYLYDGIKIRIESNTLFGGQFAIDDVSVDEDGIAIPLANPTFDDGHRRLSGGDSAATFLSRLNGTAFWGSLTHHESNGHSFDAHPYETLIYFLRGLPLGDAVWFAEFHNSGILYGDPLYSPAAIHLHYLKAADGRAPADYFYTAADSPLALTGDTLNGSGTDVTTTYSVDYCSGNDFLPCDQNGSWVPMAGLQNRPGGQRNMSLGSWDISALAEGDYVLRLAVTSANSSSGLSQTFYDYYTVTLYTPLSDTDADGLVNQDEVALGTNPWGLDSDDDGLPDGWEVQHTLNPVVANTNTDSDADSFTDYVEFVRGSDPSDDQSLPVVSVLEVDPVNGINDGQSPFRTVTAAINSARAGDTIKLLPGDHVASFLYPNFPLFLQGQADKSAVLYPAFIGNGARETIVISDLSIQSTGLTISGKGWRFERNDFSTSVNLGSSSSAEFVNNIFANAGGDAVNVSRDASAVLANNTLTGNSVGVRATASSTVQIINSIVSGNTIADLVGVPQGGVSYSLVGDASFAGVNGNISANPLFVDPLNGDYHLQPGSPAVDAGDPQSDFSQEPVSYFNRINMGRYGNTAEAAVNLVPPVSRVDISGTVKTSNGTDVCAMVLASGKYMFSCSPWGVFSLGNLPREADGTVNLQVFADGFLPYKQTLTGSGTVAVTMTGAGICPNYNPPSNADVYPGSAGQWITISGRVAVGSNSTIPVCAMVLANGQHAFSCDGTGSYNLDAPLDSNGQVTLQVFADGFAPYRVSIDEFQPVNDVLMARASECQ